MTFLQVFLVTFAASIAFFQIMMQLADRWNREDAEIRHILHGRMLMVDGQWIVFQEDGRPLCNLSAYFDDLPVRHYSRLGEATV